ncbi:sensor protein ZraS [Andreesenia angusta]|uniref:histidine kinase n=1 Tax=Andreesenia angusta TaxID=39480 RepID=A0A1S1V4K4_9FIRM|nr:transporter substrate-binding domain-containing protein [Andreesenia angusta]OHW61355.1 sensor protein ZraS [Andreesenia angusta]
MKKIVIFVFIAFVLSFNTVYSEPLSLKIGGDLYYPPYEYLDENGVYKGFNVDITNAISLELGIDISLEPLEWNIAMEKLRNGELDALQGALQSESRMEYLDFSEEFLENSQVIFVRSDNQFIKELDDLNGLDVAIQEDDIAYESVSLIEGISLHKFKSQNEGIEALLDGKVEAFVGDRLTGLYFIQKNKYFDKIKISGEVMKTSPYAFAVSKGDEETLKLINRGISKIKSNGTYHKIYKKWFGEEIADIGKWKNLFYLAIAFLLAVCAFMLLTIKLNRILKREVCKRTEQLRAGKLDLAKENRLKGKIIENVATGIIAFDAHGRITSINEFAKKSLGLEISKGDSFSEIPLFHGKDFSSVKTSVLESPIEEEILLKTESGSEKVLVYKLLPISDKNQSDGLLFCLFDLTEERNLNRIIAHSDKMQSLGVLSAAIAHEIRNPLTSIKMFVDMVPLKGEDSDFLSKFSKIVPSEINRLNELTSVLLDYSKPSSSNPIEVALSDVVESVLLLAKPYFKKRQIAISKNFKEIVFWADPSQLKQILLNILLNSVDAIEDSGSIAISASETVDRVYISIEDSGHGIEERVLPKIFDPFYTSKKCGHGIGLPITKNLVSENSGSIDIETELGKGTTVRLSFPKKSKGD